MKNVRLFKNYRVRNNPVIESMELCLGECVVYNKLSANVVHWMVHSHLFNQSQKCSPSGVNPFLSPVTLNQWYLADKQWNAYLIHAFSDIILPFESLCYL